MQKNNCDYNYNGDLTVSPAIPATSFVYRRPRSLVQHLARRVNFKHVAHVALVSGSFISGGLLAFRAADFNLISPIGAFGASLVFMGVGLVFSEEDTQTPEEYRQFVISHFERRGEMPPRWTLQVEVGQTWRHRGLLGYISKRHYKVISVENDVARCLVTDVHGGPIMDNGQARFCEVRTFVLQYAYQLVGGAS